MELFSLDPGLAIWTWITFGLLFLILWKFVFPPIFRTIADREALIAKGVDNARVADENLKKMEEEHRELIRKAREEADGILREARAESEKLKERLLENARTEAREIVQEGRTAALEERDLLIASLREEIAGLICDSSEKVIGRSFLDREDRAWAREMAETL